jgi:hypothetical protein
LNISVAGMPEDRFPAPDETILVQWSLFDQLAAEDDLPSCLIPLGDGDYQMTFNSDWTAVVLSEFPLISPKFSNVSFENSILSPLYPSGDFIVGSPGTFYG